MKPEMIERIDKINRGEVPDGYKVVRHKIIPNEWDIRKASDVVDLLGGNAFSSKDSVEKGVRWLKIANVGIGKIVWDTIDFLPDVYMEQYDRYLLKENDIVMALTRPILNGKLKIAKIQQKDAPSLLNQRVAKVIEKNGISADYIYHYFSKPSTVSEIENVIAGMDPPNLGFENFKRIDLLIPPEEEQQKIADILTTWDKAIELKEKLIEQKKEQKKGLMQRLLTGKVRLKGFEGEWEEIELGDLGEFKTSSVDKKVDDNQQFVDLVNYMDVYHNRIIDDNINFMKVSASDREIETFNVEYGDVLFTPSSETPDDIGHSAVVKIRNKKALYSYHLVRMRFKREMDINFKAYIFNSDAVLKEFSRRATGATRYTLSIKDFQEIRIRIPKNLDEQRKIGDILLLADNEIKLLQQELEALKQQKKGLMQLLLTGKVRVKC